MENFRKHLDKKFASYPKSRQLDELKEELAVTLAERYQEYLAMDMDNERAYEMSLESIGDCKEAACLIENSVDKNTKQLRNKMAILGSGLYWLIIATAYLAISLFSKRWEVTWVVFPAAAAVYFALFLAVYYPKGKSMGKTIKIRAVAMLLFFIITLGAYLWVSFATRKWDITWVVILAGIALALMFDAAIIRPHSQKLFVLYIHLIAMFLTTVLYQIVSHFGIMPWKVSWLIYLFAAIVLLAYNFIRIYARYKSETSFKN